MEETEKLLALAAQIGFSQAGKLKPEALLARPEIRAMCEAGRCANYGHSWSCPPAPVCGSVESMQKRFEACRGGILVQTTVRLSDPLDADAIFAAEKVHKTRFDTLARQARLLCPDCFPMTAGGCRRCHKCTYPDRPCRFPEKLYPSMEACGLWVSEVCEKSGMGYYYGENTITYTAAILL